MSILKFSIDEYRVSVNLSGKGNFAESYLSNEEINKAPECQELGCSPSFSAYTRDKNEKPDTSKFSTLHCCGGQMWPA